MADFTAGFETGVHGNTIATTDAGNATAWNAVLNSPTYSNVQAHSGTLSCVTDAAADIVSWNAVGVTDHYGRIYAYLTADTGSNFISIGRTNDSGNIQNLACWYTDRKFTVTWNGGFTVGTTVIPLNQWVRYEYHVVHHISAGSIEVKIFTSPESTTPTETLTETSKSTQVAAGLYEFGQPQGTGATLYVDSIIANATSYPGPVAGPVPTFLPTQPSLRW